MRRAGALMATLLALIPVTAGAATVDPALLRGALSDPLDGAFVEAGVAADTLEGPFDAITFTKVEYTDADLQKSIQERLKYDGFITGYGRTFYKEAADAWLVEDVFAFGSASDATSYWGWDSAGLRESTYTTRVVDTTAIPTSLGAEYLLDGFHGTEIRFARGNDVYEVMIGTSSDYMTAAAIAQAVRVRSDAPANSLPPSAQREAHPGPIFIRNVSYGLGVLLAVALGLSVIAGTVVIVLLVRRSRRSTAPSALLSADGQYWWDGQAWRPTTPR
jgi:hypothetical protein